MPCGIRRNSAISQTLQVIRSVRFQTVLSVFGQPRALCFCYEIQLVDLPSDEVSLRMAPKILLEAVPVAVFERRYSNER